MTEYRRLGTPGATWFFTVNLTERHGNTRLITHVAALRRSFALVRRRHPFHIEAIVILPDHLHYLWRLPDGDADNAIRWGLIKAGFSRALPGDERISASRRSRGERGIWQRRFWEHQIRDVATTPRMLITSITTLLSMATPVPQPRGHILRFTPSWRKESTRLIGPLRRASGLGAANSLRMR
jgi:REP element-mobilizing transposase RayT